MSTHDEPTTDEIAIRELLTRWAAGVRAKDMRAILAHHAADISMFDVPLPFESRGIEAYERTWALFYAEQPKPVAFDFKRLDIIAGTQVAFAFAHMQCAELDAQGRRVPLDFRLTVGLRKVDERWTVVHEHHSVPAVVSA